MTTIDPTQNPVASPIPVAPQATPTDPMATKQSLEEEPSDAVIANVKKWALRVKAARDDREEDFDRLREDMGIAFGLQWHGQKDLDDDRYVSNIILKAVNNKVASLYARDPKAIARRRQRLDFQIWDEHVETLQANIPMAMAGNPAAMAMLADYQQGTARRALTDKVCRSLELNYEYMVDQCQPPFKTQMKQLVRRAVTCGVAYVRINFSRDYENTLSTSETESSMAERAKRAKAIAQEIIDGDIDETSAQVETLKMLANSLGASVQDGDQQNIQERLCFDFPPATSIIVDPRCRSLKGFVGAKWIAQEYVLPLEEVNAFFGTDIDYSGGVEIYNEDGESQNATKSNTKSDEIEDDCSRRVALWEVFDLTTKNHFFIIDGHDNYVMAPEPVEPSISQFWPILALTFNDCETEQGMSIYPPSDVRLMYSAQKEWNRARQRLREQRQANAPKYMTGKGWLTEDDLNAIRDAVPNSIVEIEGAAPGTDIGKLLASFQHAVIDPALYDTSPFVTDILYAVGEQQSNFGPTSQGTATAATISEQSRLSVTTSNVDDLDDLLSAMARAGGEMLIRELSPDTATRVAGIGAVWPDETQREDYLNELYLEIVAASSGRPNKALEIANFERIAPLLQAAGANPNFIVREGIKRLDDRLDPSDAFPLIPQAPPAPMSQTAKPKQASENPTGRPPGHPPMINEVEGKVGTPNANNQPLQSLPSQSPVPLAGA